MAHPYQVPSTLPQGYQAPYALGQQQQQQEQQAPPDFGDVDITHFENIALQDWYRQAEKEEQNKLKRLWLTQIAPKAHPQVFQNPRMRNALQSQIMNMNVPSKVEDEDRIITPDTLTRDGIAKIEESPLFANKTFEEQQALKHIWFMKMTNANPEFAEMNPKQQQAYYERLMGRVPSFSAGLDNKRSQSGLILPFIGDDNEDNFYNESAAKRGLAAAAANFANSFVSMSTSLVTAPLRLLAGEDSGLAETLNNLEKEQAYFNYISQDTNQLLTSFAPTLAGTAAGIIVPGAPFPGFERIFAGGIKGGTKIAGISSKAGLVEKGARAVGLGKAPQITYQVAGGAIAGGLQGISQAISEGKDWKTYIPTDMTVGVGFELLARTVGMHRATRQAARSIGMDPKEFVRKASKIEPGKPLSPEMAEAFRANPEMMMFLRPVKELHDKTGLSIDLMESAQGVKAHADVLGFQVRETDESLQIVRNDTVEAEFKDSKPQRYRDALDWLDDNPEAWDAFYKTAPGKQISEIINMAPRVEFVQSDVVPQFGRKILSRTLKEHGVWTGTSPKPRATVDAPLQDIKTRNALIYKQGGLQKGWARELKSKPTDWLEQESRLVDADHARFSKMPKTANAVRLQNAAVARAKVISEELEARKLDPSRAPKQQATEEGLDPRARRNEQLSELYRIVRDKSTDKAASAFRARGIIFSEVEEEHRAVIDQIKSNLDYFNPKKPYIIVNKESHEVVNTQNMPVYFAEHPDINNPSRIRRIFAGKPEDIRRQLNTFNRQATTAKREATKTANQGHVELLDFGENSPVEMRLKIPDAKGELIDSIIHFPSLKSARRVMNRGTTTGVKSVINELYPGRKNQDAFFRQSYKSFDKEMRLFNREAYENDFLPFQFLVQQARQQNYYLGAFKGKYMIEDALTDDVSVRQFDTLRDVSQFLKQRDGRAVTDEMLGPMSADAHESVNGKVARDPLQNDFPYEEIKRNRRFGIHHNFRRKFQPTKYYMQEINRMPIMREIEHAYNINPVRMFNRVQDMTRAHNAWQAQRVKEGRAATAGIKDSEMQYLWRYRQAFESDAEFQGSQLDNMGHVEYEIRSDIYDEMVSNIGRDRADAIVESDAKVKAFFDKLFKEMGLDWETYNKAYLPHLYKEFSRGNINVTNTELQKRLTAIPDGHEKRSFMEFMRTADPRDLVLNTNVRELIETYTHVAGRKIFLRPQMKAMADELEVVKDGFKANKNLTDADWEVFVNYTRNLMSVIEGVTGESDTLARYATKRTMEGLETELRKHMSADQAKKLIDSSKRTPDLMSKLITYSVGSHLALRPYTLFRNLTQSLITGGALINARWWAEGVSALQKPGAISEVFDEGIVSFRQVPAGTGEVKTGVGGPVQRAVETGMIPYMGTDWTNRAIVWHGMGARVDDAIKRYKAGKITRERFLRDSGARLFSKEDFNELGRILNNAPDFDSGLAAYKDRIRRLAVEETQFLYNKFDQPEAFRSGMGRFFGQYTSWPNTYFNFVRSRISRHSAMTPIEKMKFMGRLTTFTGAVGMAVHEAGINPYSFYPWNMAVMSPGPYHQMIMDTINGINGNKMAWQRAVRGMTSVIPFAYAGEGIVEAVKAFNDGYMWEGFLHLASAPPRMDQFPSRSVPLDNVEKTLIEAGDKYIDFTRSDFYGNVKEGF